MQLRVRNLLMAVAVGAATLIGNSARADFQILILVDDVVVSAITDGDATDTNPLPGQISFNAAALNTDLSAANAPYFFTGLNASSNQPNGGISATLGQDGSFFFTGDAQTPATALTIIAAASDYNFPVGAGKLMRTSSTTNVTNVTAGDTRTFQSFLDPNNFGGTGTLLPDPTPVPGSPSALQTGVAPGGSVGMVNSLTMSNNPDAVFVATANPAYGLSNVSVFNVTANTFGAGNEPFVQFTGATTVVVPEPSAVLMMGLGLPMLGLLRLRRKAS